MFSEKKGKNLLLQVAPNIAGKVVQAGSQQGNKRNRVGRKRQVVASCGEGNSAYTLVNQ